MSLSLISRIGLRGRIAVLLFACALATAGAMALIGSATSRAASSRLGAGCSMATMNGTYTSAAISWSTGTPATPIAQANFIQFNGNGGVLGKATVVTNSQIEFGPFASDSGSYTMSSNCTGTLTVLIGSTTAHFDLYASPTGDIASEVETGVTSGSQTLPNGPFAVTDTRVSQVPLIQGQ